MQSVSPVAGIQPASFLLLVALTTVAFFVLVKDFLMPVFWAAVLATLFAPMQRRYVAAVRGRRSVAALLTMVTILLLVVAPLVGVGLALTREVVTFAEQVQSGAIDLRAPLRWAAGVTPLVTRYLERFGVGVDALNERLSTGAVAVSQFLASRALALGKIFSSSWRSSP